MDRLAALFRATSTLSATHDLDSVLARALGLVTETLKVEAAAILLPTEEDPDFLEVRASVGYRPDVAREHRAPISAGVTGRSMETGEVINVSNVQADPDYIVGVAGARSEIAIPLLGEGLPIGVLDLESRREGAFDDPADVQLLLIFAGHLGTAINNAARWARIQVQNKDLEIAARIGRIATSTLNLAELLERSLRIIRPRVRASHLDFLLWLPETGELKVLATESTKAVRTLPRGTRVRVDECVSGAAIRRRRTVVVDDVENDSRYFEVSPGTRSEVVVPVSYGGETIGVLNAESHRKGAFGRDEVQVLSSLGTTLAAAVRNALLYQDLLDISDRGAWAAEFARRINMTLELEEILEITARHLPRLAGADKISILLEDDGEDRLVAGDRVDEKGPEDRIEISLRFGAEDVGRVLLSQPSAGKFDSHQSLIAQMAGEHLAAAVANSRLYERTRKLSQTDGLTGLLVHRAFYERLDEAIEVSRRDRSQFSLIMGDLDGFKAINDRYGHPFGDRVLATAARIIAEHSSDDGVAARYGGEEFCVLLPGVGEDVAWSVAERIRSRLGAEEIPTREGVVQITISFGVGSFDPRRTTRSELLETVDQALYRAKNGGRNRSVLASGLTSK